jgi:hypothetical protein
MSGAKRIFVNHPIHDATNDEIKEKADSAVAAVIKTLSESNSESESNNE